MRMIMEFASRITYKIVRGSADCNKIRVKHKRRVRQNSYIGHRLNSNKLARHRGPYDSSFRMVSKRARYAFRTEAR
jgi:hypothetical protein